MMDMWVLLRIQSSDKRNLGFERLEATASSLGCHDWVLGHSDPGVMIGFLAVPIRQRELLPRGHLWLGLGPTRQLRPSRCLCHELCHLLGCPRFQSRRNLGTLVFGAPVRGLGLEQRTRCLDCRALKTTAAMI